MRRTLVALAVCLALVASIGFVGGKMAIAADKEVWVALNNEKTGMVPIVGRSSLEGCSMAIEEVNAQGGLEIGGEKYLVKLEEFDNEFKPESALLNAQKIVNTKKFVAMIGPNDSANCMPCAPVIERGKLPTITPWATNPKITQNTTYFFRACYTDDFQGAVDAKFAYEHEGARTAAVLYDITNDYNKGLSEIFKKVFEEIGGEVVAFEAYSRGDKDFRSQLTKIVAAEPDLLFLPNFYQEVPLQVEQALSLGFKGILFGSDTWGSDELIKLAGDNVEGSFWSGHYAPDMATPVAKSFIDSYTEKYGRTPDDVAALNYDAMHLLFLALQKAGKVDRVAVKEQLSSIEQFEGVTGTMTFEGSGDPVKSAVMIKIEDGQFKYYATAQP